MIKSLVVSCIIWETVMLFFKNVWRISLKVFHRKKRLKLVKKLAVCVELCISKAACKNVQSSLAQMVVQLKAANAIAKLAPITSFRAELESNKAVLL